MELSHLAFTIQALSVPPVALLLWQLTRAVPGHFLVSWARGWGLLAVSLFCLRLAISVEPNSVAARLGYAGYSCLEYTAGFLLWAGSRELATGRQLTAGDWWRLVPALVFGSVAPFAFATTDAMYVFHAPLFGAFFLLALVALRGYRPEGVPPHVGLPVVRGCLLALGLVFFHYGIVTGWAVHFAESQPFEYMYISPMFDALVELGLALGMAMVAVERVRDKLVLANRKLAEVTDQLAITAKTDPLTGLLNRRALDAILADRKDDEFAGSVAVIDLNNLKRLNDTMGHAAGDAAIQLVARALRTQFRIGDLLFRVGGDEFLAILEGGRAADLAGRLEAVDAALKAQRLATSDESVDLIIAWGMADFDTPAGFAAALHQADGAMYTCKAERKAGVPV